MKIRQFLLFIMITLLSSCHSELAVFLPSIKGLTAFDGLESVQLNESGQFELNWSAAKFGREKNAAYEIYLIKKIEPPALALSLLNAESGDLLATVEGNSDDLGDPAQSGELVATVSDANSFIYTDTIDSDLYYIFEVKVAGKSLKRKDNQKKIFLSKVNFPSVSQTLITPQTDGISLSWPAMPGVSTYLIFSREKDATPAYETKEPTLSLGIFDASLNHTYCMRAARGTLISKACLPILGIGTSWKPIIVGLSKEQPLTYAEAGDELTFLVKFSDRLRVLDNTLSLPLLLKDGSSRKAKYVRGSGTDTLSFSYTVIDGDNTSMISFGESLEAQKSEALIDTSLRYANLSLHGQGISPYPVFDTVFPTQPESPGFASQVTSQMAVKLSWTGGLDENFDHYTVKLCESFDCQTDCTVPKESADQSTLIEVADNKTYFGCVAATDKAAHVTAFVGSLNSIAIDRTAPSVIDISSPNASGIYSTGAPLSLQVRFNEPVFYPDAAAIKLKVRLSGSSTMTLALQGGNGTDTLTFLYTVEPADNSSLLDVESSQALTTVGPNLIKDLAGNPALLTLPLPASAQSLAGHRSFIIDTQTPTAPGVVNLSSATTTTAAIAVTWTAGSDANLVGYNAKVCSDSQCSTSCTTPVTINALSTTLTAVAQGSYYACVRSLDGAGLSSAWKASGASILFDSVVPTVLSVSTSLADGVYTSGTVLPITVTFSESVDIATPNALSLALSLSTRSATYVSGNGNSSLNFAYTIQAGDNVEDLDYLSTGGLSGSVVRDSAGNTANLTLPGLGNGSLFPNAQISVDTQAPGAPTSVSVSNATSTPTTYGVVWTASSDLHLKEHKVKLCLNSDCSTGCLAELTATSYSQSLTGVASQPYKGCVRGIDEVGLSSAFTASTGAILTDDTPPTVLSVSSSAANGFYKAGSVIPILVNFSEPVSVQTASGITLSLATGSSGTVLSLSGGEGSSSLEFTYTVTSGDMASNLDLISSTSLAVATGSSVKDAAGNTALLTLPSPGAAQSLGVLKNIVIDTIPPVPPSSVGFSSATINSATVPMTWLTGTDTNFKSHEVKLCPASACSASCVAPATVAGASHSFTAVPDGSYYGCAQSVDKANQTSLWIASLNPISVDSTAPTIKSVTATNADGAYKSSTNINLTIEFTEPVAVSAGAVLGLTLETGITDRVAQYVTGTGSSVLSFTYTVQAGDSSARLNYKDATSLVLSSGTVKDLHGNNAVLGLPALTAADALGVMKNIVIDTVSPVPAFVSPLAATPFNSQLTLELSCESGDKVAISGNIVTPLSNITCVAGSITRTVFLPAGEGTKTITLTETDAAGNVGTATRSFINDTVAPTLTQSTLLSPYYSNTSTLTIGGTCETSLDVFIYLAGSLDGQTTCNGNWSYTLSSQSVDGARSYTLSQTDNAGNRRDIAFVWSRDTVAPNFSFDDLSATFTGSANANSFTFSGYCESSSSVTNPSLLISGPGISTSVQTSCVNGRWTYSSPSQSSNGLFLYTFIQSDRALNTTTIYGSWTRNASAPTLTSTLSTMKSKLSTVTFTGNCTDAFPIVITGPGSPANLSCSGGAFSFTTPSQSADGSFVYNLSQTSMLGDSATLQLTQIHDTTPPVLQSIALNGGATVTLDSRVNVDLKTSDALTPITQICFLQRVWANASTPPAVPAAPVASDSCWTAVNQLGGSSGTTVQLYSTPLGLGLASAKYSVYFASRDEVGNISQPSDTEGTGRGTITFTAPSAPLVEILDLTDASNASKSDFAAGDDVVMHWKVTGGSHLGANPVNIRWSIDDKSWTYYETAKPIGASNCTALSGATGCLKFSSPTSSYFRLQLAIKNTNNDLYLRETRPLNTLGKVRVVAGRTFQGLEGNPKGFFINTRNAANLTSTAPHTFVVTREGTIYFIDTASGVLKADPKDKVVKVLFPRGTYSGDGAIVANKPFSNPTLIFLDDRYPSQRLWITDNNDVRVVDFNTNLIKSFNQSSSSKVTGMGGTGDIFFTKAGIFGRTDFYFQGSWKNLPTSFNETTGKMDVVEMENPYPYLSGYNSSFNDDCGYINPGYLPLLNSSGTYFRFLSLMINTSRCNGAHVFDVNLSGLQATYVGESGQSGMIASLPSGNENFHIGLNGKNYTFGRNAGSKAGAHLYDETSNTWTKVIGQTNAALPSNRFSCADDTLATACDVDIYDLFVDEQGIKYFMDQGKIRLVDAEGKVQTVLGTSSKSFSSNLSATDTILGNDLKYFQRRITDLNQEEVVFNHFTTKTYRKVASNSIDVLAGNGLSWGGTLGASTGPAAGVTESQWSTTTNNPFAMDSDGNVYAGEYQAGGPSVLKLSRSSLTWSVAIPFSCTGCSGIAYPAFDAYSGSVNANAKVQVNSGVLGAPTPNTLSGNTFGIRPTLWGLDGSKLLMGTADSYITYTGTTNGTHTSSFVYTVNALFSQADISTFDGTTVKNVTRIMGSTGTAPNSGFIVDCCSRWIGAYTYLPVDGTPANQHPVQLATVDSSKPSPLGLQSYWGSHFTSFKFYPRNLLKTTNNVVNRYANTNVDMRNFRLVKMGSDDVLFYCGTDGVLRKRNMTTPTTPVEKTVSLYVPGAKCWEGTLLSYQRDSANYLMLTFMQNGLTGILELAIDP
ncbi:MAG: hypothetical protein EOP10_01130 [Proteobacteria bacterium]|nr:MAG: hypothetical protein EOP10_01130 [Pseudomonadota bacterium]